MVRGCFVWGYQAPNAKTKLTTPNKSVWWFGWKDLTSHHREYTFETCVGIWKEKSSIFSPHKVHRFCLLFKCLLTRKLAAFQPGRLIHPVFLCEKKVIEKERPENKISQKAVVWVFERFCLELSITERFWTTFFSLTASQQMGCLQV